MNLSNPSPSHYVTIDATREVAVRVTGKDIRNGIPGDPENCAIARAFGRTFSKDHKGVSVRVFRTSVWVAYEGTDGARTIELFNLDSNGKNLIASVDTTGTAYPVLVTIKPRPKAKTKAARAVQNQRRQQRIAKGIPPNTKYHSNGGAKGTARTLAGVRSGSNVPAHP